MRISDRPERSSIISLATIKVTEIDVIGMAEDQMILGREVNGGCWSMVS